MMNAIDEIKRQYIYTVQPVKLFEEQKNKATQSNSFDFISRLNPKESTFNPFHPNVMDEKNANKLDLLG